MRTFSRPRNLSKPGLFAAAWLVLVASRLIARQKTLWEWDDFVFQLALHHFAPQAQVPHPPFYPGYVYLARAARLLVRDDVLALTGVSVIASIAALVFLYLIVLELLASPRTALTAVTVFALSPAVWLHAGVPLSDPAGLAFALAAIWLSLLSLRKPSWLAAAAVTLGAAFSVRPQTSLIAAAALVTALWRSRGRRRWLAAGALPASIAAFYAAPIILSAGGIEGVWRWVCYQAQFVLAKDSLAAHGWQWELVIRRYFLDVWVSPVLAMLVHSLMLIGFLVLTWRRRGRSLALLASSFLPYAVMAWIFLNPSTAPRYALPYLPLQAVLVGVAIVEIERRLVPGKLPLLALLLVVFSATVTLPAVLLLHSSPSPPVFAAQEIKRMAAHNPFRLAYHSSLLLHAEALFPNTAKVAIKKDEDLCWVPLDGTPVWAFGLNAGGNVAAWPPLPALTRATRGRYLEVPFGRLTEVCVQYGEGWYRPEAEGTTKVTPRRFRWMAREGTISIPPALVDLGLEIEARLPLWALPRPPRITLLANGKVVGEIEARSVSWREVLRIPKESLSDSEANVITLRTSETFVPSTTGASSDHRELGLQLFRLVVRPWGDRLSEP